MGNAITVQAFRYCLGLGWRIGVRLHLGQEQKELYAQTAFEDRFEEYSCVANSTAISIVCAFEAVGINANLLTIN